MIDKLRVKPQELTRSCEADPFNFTTTADLAPLDRIIGQKRAVEAIDFGLKMRGPGYHIFISGAESTGKSTITHEILNAHAGLQETPNDLCLVNDFDDPYHPRPIEMPTGSAMFFSRRMDQFIETMADKLPQAFENEAFKDKQQTIKKDFLDRKQALFLPVEAHARGLGIGIVQTEEGFQPVPMGKEGPVTPEEFNAYDPDKKAALESALSEVGQKLNDMLAKVGSLAEEMQTAIEKNAVAAASAVFSEEMDLLFSSFRNWPKARGFLDEVKNDMAENSIQLLLATRHGEGGQSEGQDIWGFLKRRYRVDVLVDRRGEKGAPVVYEPTPTYQNLFGTVGQVKFRDKGTADFGRVQPGALLKANRGYLVLEVEPLLRNPLVWETLKNTLQNRKLVIQDPADQSPAAAMKSRPIRVDVKVILLGGYEIFRALQGEDSKFNKIFKVRADFDSEAELTPENLIDYARFIARACKSENLLPFTPCGVTAVVEYGSRIVEDKRKLSLRFGQVLGLLKEGDYWARGENAAAVADRHVRHALKAYRFRHNLYEEKIQQRYDDQSILMDVTGRVVGQVNALAVYQLGEISFGRPSRITAESYMGTPGIINVEHEAQLSGQTHDKGMMIIAGYLGRMFAQNYPLSVSVSITFEQNYGGVDGDSASSTELYAVLSSLSGYPIDQGIAVTGSVNQKGEIQSIGGVNEKIEGFFDVCRKKGLTRDQGVMIPASNLNNLMLRRDVVKAVDKGIFHIYRVRSIEEGIEILTGIPAGVADRDGLFPEGSLYGAVQAKLKMFHERSVKYCR